MKMKPIRLHCRTQRHGRAPHSWMMVMVQICHRIFCHSRLDTHRHRQRRAQLQIFPMEICTSNRRSQVQSISTMHTQLIRPAIEHCSIQKIGIWP